MTIDKTPHSTHTFNGIIPLNWDPLICSPRFSMMSRLCKCLYLYTVVVYQNRWKGSHVSYIFHMESKHNLIRSHFFFLYGYSHCRTISASGSIPLPSRWMMPLFHADSSSTTILSVPVRASSYQLPAVYVCIEILDKVLCLLYPSHFWYTVLIFLSNGVNPTQIAPSSMSGDVHFCLCCLGLYRQWREF